MPGNRRALVTFILFLISGLPSQGWSAATSPLPQIIPVRPEPSVQTQSGGDTLTILTYEVELGKVLSIPTNNPTFHLVKSPEIASVTQLKPDEILILGQKIGETLILVWEAGTLRSYRIRVTRPIEELKRLEKIRIEGSKFFREQKKKTFKAIYDSTFNFLRENRVFPRIKETRKVYDHRVRVEGHTPYGQVKSALYYENRKEDRLQKSVAIPRDFWGGIFDTRLPFLNHYNIIGGAQYQKLSEFGFSGQRYSGITVIPAPMRAENPQKGQWNLHYLFGEKRDGSVYDHPPGSQNRNVHGMLMGEKLDFHPWEKGRLSLGAYHQWSAPRSKFESANNYDAQMDFQFPFIRLEGETGMDDANHQAFQLKTSLDHPWGQFSGRTYNVNNNYRTLTGGVLDRGNRGFQLKSVLYPLWPILENDSLTLSTEVDWTRNHLSVNPGRPGRFVTTAKTGIRWVLPYDVVSDTSLLYSDQQASSFPFTEKEIRQRIEKRINLNFFLLRSITVFTTGTIEAFREAENIAGFNSTRFETGGGISTQWKGGFYVATQALINRLKEEEEDLAVPPRPVTHPRQVTLSGGWSHSFDKLPVGINLGVRYVDEGSTHNKTHQPFLNEDRIEFYGGMDWRLRELGEFFIQSSASYSKSTVGDPNKAEFTLMSGFKMIFDTHFYIPQTGQIRGVLFEDRNGNGVRDPGEPGIMGHQIMIENGPKTETDAEGYYELRVPEGLCKLVSTGTIPEGYFFTTPNFQEIEVFPESEYSVDFGIAPQVQVKGRAFLDINENGIFEKGDEPLPRIQVVLKSGQAAITSSQGVYSMLRVPSGPNEIRIVVESIPSGYKTVTPTQKSFDGTPGDVVNFNLVLATQRVAIGYVFVDENKNGKRDTGEKGISGALIRLNEKQYQTNQNGKYVITDINIGLQQIVLDTTGISQDFEATIKEYTLDTGKGYFSEHKLDFPVIKKSLSHEEITSD